MTSYYRAAWDSVAPGDTYSDVYGDYGLPSVDTAAANRVVAAHVTDLAGATDSVTYTALVRPHYFATVADVAGASDQITGIHATRINVGVTEVAGASDSATAAITYRVPSGGVHLRVWDKTGGVLLGILPEFDTLHVNVEHNDVGGIEFDYPLSGKNIDVLTGLKAAIISAHEGTREIATAHWTSDGDDPGSDEGDDRPLAVAANGTLDLLSWIELYPDGGLNHLPKLTFGNAAGGVTPGAALLTLLARGQARGCLDGVTAPLVVPTFTDTHDSAGQPWPFPLWLQYDAGQDLLFVVHDLVERGFIDTRMRRFTWDVYVQDTTLAGDRPDVTLHRSRELESAPRTSDRTAIRTALLLIGEGNVSTEVVDAQAIADYGRREGNSGQSGISRSSVLSTIGSKQIADLKRIKEGFTANYDRTAGGPQPMLDYLTGEFVRADWYVDPNTGANLPLRVRTISATYDSSGVRDAEVELGDLFLEAEVVLKRQVDALTKGTSTVVGAPPTPVNSDIVGPVPPAQVLVTSDIEMGADGRGLAWALVSWPPVLENTDGTPFDDDGGYHVSWRTSVPGSYTGSVVTEPGATSVLVPGLPPGATFTARVSAWDSNGNYSDDAASLPTLLARDVTPPPTPSPPQLEATIGGLRATWDGHPVGWPGVQWPADFARVQAFVSETDVFADAVAAGGPLTGPGTITLSGLDYGVPQFVWLVAYDLAGNASSPSDTGGGVDGGAAGTPVQVLAPDLGGGAVGPDALAFRDFGNKVPDGSFELQATRDRLAASAAWASGVWSFVNGGASDGGWYLQADATVAPATQRDLPLITGIEAIAGDKLWFTFNAKGTAGAGGQAQLVVRARNAAGLVVAETVLVTSAATGSWTPPDTLGGAGAGQAFTYTFPATIATVDVLVRIPPAAQLGTWGFDAVNVRQMIQTAVIDQEAVGSAQIKQAAIGDLQVGTIGVGKIGAGSITAPYIALGNGLLTTTSAGQQSGQRLELDATGLRAYDSSSTSPSTGMTVRIGSDGTALFAGDIGAGGLVGGSITGTTFFTSASRPRVVMGPTIATMFGDDPLGTVGLMFQGPEIQAAEPRITTYRYQTSAAPDYNVGLALRGGIANWPAGFSTANVQANSIIVHPRDATDEANESDSFDRFGIQLNVGQVQVIGGNALDFFFTLVARAHVASYGYVGLFEWQNDVGLGFDSGQLVATNHAASTTAYMNATDFLRSSERATKDDLEDVDALGIIRGASSRRFRYRHQDPEMTHGWSVGPVVEDLPEWLHVVHGETGARSLGAHTMAGMAWRGVEQLAGELDALREAVGRLGSRP